MVHPYLPTEVRRRQIAEAALALIADQGLDGFTTRAIAERVKINEATIFRHFKRKQDIALAAMDLLEEQLFCELPDDTDPLARLEAFFRHRAELVASQGAWGHLVFSDQLIHAAGGVGREKVQGWQRRSFDLMRSALAPLRLQGRLRADLEIEQLLRLVQGMVLVFYAERTVDGSVAPAVLQARIAERWVVFCRLVLA